VTITNSAAGTLARSLALELDPIRVNAVSPRVIDAGAWDALGEWGKADYLARVSASNLARCIGTPEDTTQGVLFAPTNTFLTGQTLGRPGLRRAGAADGGGNDPGAGDGGARRLRGDDRGISHRVARQRGAGLRPEGQVSVGP
jgi:NAD(P)-dependent dehydrogenase (short-subunit alcohol dehydrogenase family)